MEKTQSGSGTFLIVFWNRGNWSANLHVWPRRAGCWKSVPWRAVLTPIAAARRTSMNTACRYIYESRDGQRTDYVKTLADMGVEKVGDMGSFLVLRKRADGAPFTLYSDLDAQIMDARRLMRIKIILAVAFALLAADWFYNTWVWYDLAVKALTRCMPT